MPKENRKDVKQLTEVLRSWILDRENTQKASPLMGCTLPAIPHLAKHFSVGVHPLSQALKQLHREGLIEIKKGKRTRIKQQNQISKTNPSLSVSPRLVKQESGLMQFQSPSEKMISELLHQLREGDFKAGDLLPSLKFQAIQRGISRRTVKQGYDILESQNQIYRKGRTWRVGRSSTSVSPKWENQPIILVLMDRDRTWDGLADGRNIKFMARFISESQNHQIRLIPFSLQEPQATRKFPHRDLEEVMRLLSAKENLFLGTLMILNPGLGQGQSDPKLIETIFARLTTLGKRACSFVRANPVLNFPLRNKQWIHASFSEDLMVREALQYIQSEGHCELGYSDLESTDWSIERREKLQTLSSTLYENIRVNTALEIRKEFFSMSRNDLSVYLQNLALNGPVRSKRLIQILKNELAVTGSDYYQLADWLKELCHPEIRRKSNEEKLESTGAVGRPGWLIAALYPVLLKPDISLIIVPRDQVGYQIYSKILELGLDVPQHISMISFDNYLKFSLMPISSVDIGAENLAHRCFRYLYGDKGVRLDGPKRLIGHPTIAHRGSIGPIAN